MSSISQHDQNADLASSLRYPPRVTPWGLGGGRQSQVLMNNTSGQAARASCLREAVLRAGVQDRCGEVR